MSLILLQERRHHISGAFINSDSEQRYQQHVESLGPQWVWYNVPIYYQLNSQGYRCREWDQIAWDNSVLFFGCSQTYGLGLPIEYTIPYLVEQGINKSCVNLGRMGTSPMFQWANSIRIHRAGLRPKAVVYIWPESSRITQFLGDPWVLSVGAWRSQHELMGWVVDPWQGMEYLRHLVWAVESLWTCNIIHVTFSEPNISVLPKAKFFDHIDSARDMVHPGPKTTQLVAQYIIEQLQSLLV